MRGRFFRSRRIMGGRGLRGWRGCWGFRWGWWRMIRCSWGGGGGATDVAAGSKVARLFELCDMFHLPVVDFADEPGLMVGLESEFAGIERAGARLVCVTCDSRVPWITFVVRRLFGVGGQTHQRPSGMFGGFGWRWGGGGSMHISGGTSAAYRREI